jgi:NAD(P)-dependent dehydrogenase (short-subunit alcohol dehydrogenase family)
MTISDSLTGRRALVTGGSTGQGAATVVRLREAGATVMTTARTMPHDAAHRDLFIAADLSTPAEPRRSSTRSVPDWAPSTSWSTSAARTHPQAVSQRSATSSGRPS